MLIGEHLMQNKHWHDTLITAVEEQLSGGKCPFMEEASEGIWTGVGYQLDRDKGFYEKREYEKCIEA